MPTAKKLIRNFFSDHPTALIKRKELADKLKISQNTAKRIFTQLHNSGYIEYHYKNLWCLKQ